MKKLTPFFALVFLLSMFMFVSLGESAIFKKNKKMSEKDYMQYTDYFEKVFEVMQENYYQPISRETFDKFVGNFKAKIFPQLMKEGKSDNYVRWRSAAYLIDYLKSSEDIFSALYPPKPAQEYKQTALGVRMDLGLEGALVDKGFQLSQVEPRSDAYEKGLRINDIISTIDGVDVKVKTNDEIKELLNPLMESKVEIKYLSTMDQSEKVATLVPMEYFKQTVFLKPVKVSGVACLEIRRFNRKTSDDLWRILSYVKSKGPLKGLVLDLRDNPGGPPLAAREISAFFLPGKEEFAYFQKRDQPKASLDVPELPENYHYDGPLVILLNKKSGSSSELFSGVLQKKGRAVLMGTNSAGQVMLKSMFDLGDESMVLLVTARGHHSDGSVFSFNGLNPDVRIPDDAPVDPIEFAAKYLVSDKNKKVN